ncbi:MAG: CCA tRNA nucleotidyltransferase [Deltaproteobacteria bacterium]|nr:CCA tRNA nucleotidyltransferase [Deltaproteobacteria bacterium]MBW2074664.1 CCA tRNA nucleotidyltransferase [Deltaproteobacteria bacterium]
MKKELIQVACQLPDFSGIGPVYLVGGSLRDRMLNRPSNDHDFAVPGNARAFAKTVAAKLGARMIEMGKGGKAVYRVVSGDKTLDFSPIHGKSIEDDLRKRDFTVNGLGFDLSSESLIDPVGGLDDIRSKTIRLISENAILADPLRMLRAFRLAAVLNFEITPQTLSVIKKHATLAAKSAGERIRAELFKMMETERSFPYLKQMSEIGLLMKLIPELEPCRDCPLHDHGYNVFQHVMRTYEEIEMILSHCPALWPEYAEPIRSYLESNRKVLLKWAGLLHDIGKPATRSIDPSGRLRFLAHEKKGAQIARCLCSRLRMSGQERSYLELIVQNHLHPLLLFNARQRGTLTTRGIVRFVRKYQDDVIGLLIHSMADQRAKPGQGTEFEGAFMAFLKEVFQKYLTDLKPRMMAPRLITGKDLIKHFGLAPSKLFAKLLQKVEEARLNREIRTREEALELVARLLDQPASRT